MNARIDRYTTIGAKITIKHCAAKCRKLNAILRDEEIDPRLTPEMWLHLDNICSEYNAQLNAAQRFLDRGSNEQVTAK